MNSDERRRSRRSHVLPIARSANGALDGDGGRFAAADAERGDAAFQVPRIRRMQQRYDQSRAGGPTGWPSAQAPPLTLSFSIKHRPGERPVLAASSTDRCNTFCELLSRRLIEQGLSRPFIELPCDGTELGLAVQGQIGAARKILAQQSVGVFV